MARKLVHYYRKSVELQLSALPHRDLNKIRDFALWLIIAIKENHQLPESIIETTAKEEEIKHAIAKKAAAIARQDEEEAHRTDFFDFLRKEQGRSRKRSQRLTELFE